MRKVVSFICLLLVGVSSLSAAPKVTAAKSVDICVYGGTSLGVIAAYTAKKQGKSVLLIEPTTHIGGMSSGGLGQTDIGNKFVVQGLALDFYRRVGAHYGALEMWVFEPHVAEKVFRQYIAEENIELWCNRRIVAAKKEGTRIVNITLEDSAAPSKKTNQVVEAKVFIDATYEGDLMAKAGVSYTVGREDNKVYNETYSGVQVMKNHQFRVDVDPYVIPGKKSSGLLWGINKKPRQPIGSGDKKVQAYNFRICLTNERENMVPITKPDNYDPSKYELLIRWKEKDPWKSLSDAFIWSKMPNNKTDINNRGAFSTDMIGANWNYPEASYEERARIIKAHEDYTKGLLYFVGHDERIPEHIRRSMLKWGYPKDEYVNNNHWTPQLYVREARRMVSDVVMTQHHCQGREVVDDGIALAAYTMDSHNCDRVVIDGFVRNEGNVEIKKDVNPYPISYRSIVPKRSEVTNLYVTFCLSASHIAFGSIRMEPVAMALSQVAATAASMAIDKHNGIVQDVDVAALKAEIEAHPWGDNRKPDVLVDDANDACVRFVGNWTFDKSRRCYAFTRRYDNTLGKEARSAYFYPRLKETDEYDVYYYYPRQKRPSSVVCFNVFDGAATHEVVLNTKGIKILGQTTGEWVRIGRYKIGAGDAPYVEITNRNADGTVVADAVQFVPVKR
ncbi:MAG: FAD-dependent oxidoreductase [Alistipes sp.]|nr:FAD-dependent oxidoreductase [Alistipes sp.]